MKCPKCQHENPDDSRFCSKCGTQIRKEEGISLSKTEEFHPPLRELTRGSLFAKRYEVIEELGRGGMAKVYRVLDKNVQEDVSLKLLNPEIASDKEAIERFRNELKMARNIAHRNICRMYDLNEENGNFFITMEYISGEDLKSLIRRIGQLSVGKAVSVAKQVCEGLVEAHKTGVVHRDLKPQNVMIDKEGNARIMDFGIARFLRAKGITDAGVMIGTPEYMSPEQVDGKEADQRSDIYSLGVIIYEMLTGKVPFEGDTPLSIALKHKTEIPSDPKDMNAQIPEDLSRVILRCMEKDKQNRYQKIEEILKDLKDIEKGIPTTDRVVPKVRTKTWIRRRRRIAIAATGIIAAAILIAAGYFLATRILPGGAWGEWFAEGRPETSIAVITFENQTGDNTLDYLQRAIPNLLITSLERSKYLRVTTWERMHDLLEQLGKGDAEIIDRDLGFKLCQRDGIDAIVLGSFIKAGEMFATDVKVLDVKTKKLLTSTSSRGEGVASILKNQIDELSQGISQGIGISGRRMQGIQQKTVEVTTNSLEAYNHYLEGQEAIEKFYWDDARRALEQAVQIDPTFAVAYLRLGFAYAKLGDSKAMKSAFEKAKTFSERATDKEKLYIEAAYADIIETDREKSLEIYKKMVGRYPKEKQALSFLGDRLYGERLYEQSIEQYNKVLELDPNFGPALNMIAYNYAELGDFEKAIEYFKKYAVVSPGDANPHDSIAEIYFRMGRLDEAIAKFKEALELKPDFGADWRIAYIYALKENYPEAMKWIDQYISAAPSVGIQIDGHSWKGFYYAWLGQFNESLNCFRKGEELAEEIENEPFKAWMSNAQGWIYYEKGQGDLSRSHFERYFDFGEKERPDYLNSYKASRNYISGLIDLKEGKINSARDRLNEMKRLLPEVTASLRERYDQAYNFLHAEVSLAEGHLDEAISAYEKSLNWKAIPVLHTGEIHGYNLPTLKDARARAYRKKGELDKAITEYERLITFDPNSNDRRLIQPLYHYRLAQIYEQKGWRGKAIEQYQIFVGILKDADKDLPEIKDAKSRLSRLTA
jgi:serine/threonine protein kinase/Tfp pilus assembly protein PilF